MSKVVQGTIAQRMRDVIVADMQHEIDVVEASGASIPNLDKIDPASLLYVTPK